MSISGIQSADLWFRMIRALQKTISLSITMKTKEIRFANKFR